MKPALPRATAAIALLLGLAAGCGVRPESQPRHIPAERLPAELAAAPADSPTSGAAAFAFRVYLVSGARLVPVERRVSEQASAMRRLAALKEGPTREEAASGLRSSLGERAAVRVVEVSQGVASVDLGADLAELFGSDRVLALAQIVFTLTDTPGIDEVRFSVERRPVATPIEDGTLIDRPLRREDFARLG